MMYKSFLTQDYIQQRIYSKIKYIKRGKSRENCENSNDMLALAASFFFVYKNIIFILNIKLHYSGM